MSCTSPWDWSMDPQPGQDQTSAAAWARNMFPQPSISASQWALVSNKIQNIQNLLVARGEGNAAIRKTRHDLLKKKFESFHFLENETLNDITTSYYHLMCEMYYFGVLASQHEMVARFANTLPPKWSPFIELLKHTGVLDAVNVNIYEFIQKLEHKNEEEIRKAKRIAPTQNTEMYLPVLVLQLVLVPFSNRSFKQRLYQIQAHLRFHSSIKVLIFRNLNPNLNLKFPQHNLNSNQVSTVVRPYSWETVIKQELRFTLKLSRMSMMVNLQEKMIVQDTMAIRMKNRI
ncbi:hypothetical protein Hdeb2414_s0003g00118771 [Helianthus debilis subsp. tardiflorus]